MTKITNIKANWILDSRSIPTIYTEVFLTDELGNIHVGRAGVPSGASTGTYEALELRDGDNDVFDGKGVLKAIENINSTALDLLNINFETAREIDEFILKIDGTENKTKLGANCILGISMAAHRAFASSLGVELWQYLSDLYFESNAEENSRFPQIMCNVINGGVHADSGLSIQEFMIIPQTGDIETDVQFCSEFYGTLKKSLKKAGYSISLGDEGGFAPHFTSCQGALEFINTTINENDKFGGKFKMALDCAASEFLSGGIYTIDKKQFNGPELVDYYSKLVENFPIISIEDGFGEDDIENWILFREKLGDKILQVGDDLYVTNTKRFQKFGIEMTAGNAILIKLNQIGSVSQTADVINLAHANNFETAVSHRSGETNDDFIADLSFAAQSKYIKIGAPARGERVSKYNRLMEIKRNL